jgi:Hypothetical protein (DUF2513)
MSFIEQCGTVAARAREEADLTRDMELIRELLLKLENLLTPPEVAVLTGHEPELAIDGYSGDQIAYHLVLLREAGLIECPGPQPALGVTFERLSWRGHDFLDSVRNPETWARTKEGARKIGNWSIGLLSDMAKAYAKYLAKEKLGLDLS